jgi:hypothetical protein
MLIQVEEIESCVEKVVYGECFGLLLKKLEFWGIGNAK